MDAYIGKTLDGRYEIIERIGTGGMAIVYKAKCHRLNRLVAVKILKSDLAQDADFRRRFHAESKAVAMLSHPNIVSVYDVSQSGDTEYIVMELIDGITLKQYIERRGQLNWRESLHFMTQIMKGLSHAHSRGIVHRDVKPQNIMVLRDGSVKVADFGIACLENAAQTLTQEALGSVHYISPEQARGDRIDARSDIYSAGVGFYEMLSGRLPFEGDSAVSVAIQHLSSIPLPPREINGEIPEQLELICMKAMAPDINKRYPSADAMVADLELFRKNPDVSLDYSIEELQDKECDEPTRHIPVASAQRGAAMAERDSSLRRRAEPERPRHRDDYYEDQGMDKKKVAVIVGGSVAVAILIFLLFRFIFSSFVSPEEMEYTVPNVVGLTMEEAYELEGVKDIFELKIIDTLSNSEYQKDVIFRQDPPAERLKKTDLVISVWVSTGEQARTMPDVLTMELRTATRLLDAMGLNLIIDDTQQEYSDEYPVGRIMESRPAFGEPLREGDSVVFIVSKGKEVPMVTMLPFEEVQIERVQEQLKTLKLELGKIDEVESDKPAGQVLEQSVKAGESVPEGTKIDFKVSKAPAGATAQSEFISIPLPPNREFVHLSIFVDEKLFKEEPAADCSMSNYPVEISGSGTVRVTVYMDGDSTVYWSDTVTFDAS